MAGGGFTTLNTALSGMMTAQAGLYVAGHNIANNEVKGYTRQNVLQNEFGYVNVGNSGKSQPMQIGLGSDINAIRQIRNQFLDIAYRDNASQYSFYEKKYAAGLEIEGIFSEMEGEYKIQSVLFDLWESLQEFELNPTALETRANFIEMSKTFLDKFSDASKNLYEYQLNLNEQVQSSVQRINYLVSTIKDMNTKISTGEASGDNANDFRDTRNNALDELATIIPITYKEDSNGMTQILCEGKDILVNNLQYNLGLRYMSEKSPFVEVVFTDSIKILPRELDSQFVRPLFDVSKPMDAIHKTDTGSLKALLLARGTKMSNYTDSESYVEEARERAENGETGFYATEPTALGDSLTESGELEYSYDMFNAGCLIPKMQIRLDTLFNQIVTSINDALAPQDAMGENGVVDQIKAPYDLAGDQPLQELFTRTSNLKLFLDDDVNNLPIVNGRYDSKGNYIGEDQREMYSLYTMGNVEINVTFADSQGYTKLAVGD
ncbi:MAG: hypothetical protein LBM16_04850, partial [Clostridiales bacterium]|nr:hypothetical protein [Clostridiales bacterium]